jgi:hypothetical protein
MFLHSFNFLPAAEETFCCGSKCMTAPIHITRRAQEMLVTVDKSW